MSFASLIIFPVTLILTNGLPLEGPRHDYKQFFKPQSTRIVGGEDAPDGFAPHSVALVVGLGAQYPVQVCGGSIVSKTHILTAAHCVEAMMWWDELIPTFRGVVGTNKWNSEEYKIRFISFLIHPGWNAWNIKNDVAFLITDKLELNDRVAIIPLNFDTMEKEAEAYVAGWGLIGTMASTPEKLQYLAVETMSPQACIDGVRAAELAWNTIAPPVDPEVEICTFHSVGHGMCNGDSGSALVWKATGQQIGIVSWGFPCAAGAPDVFASISGAGDFIQNELSRAT